MERNSDGFTMIELLIVIGVLGILAMGVLTTTDPFEQFKKARDYNRLSMATSIGIAVVRYYALGLPLNAVALNGTALDSVEGLAVVRSLIGTGDLKQNFDEEKTLSQMFMTIDTEYKGLAVCFVPESKSYKNNRVLAMYDVSGNVDPGCIDNCYICSKNSR